MKNLDKILSLIAQTGDKFIVNSEVGDFVVMNLESYEKLLKKGVPKLDELSEEELVDKINGEIADWRESQLEELKTPFDEASSNQNLSNLEEKKPEDDQYYLEPVD